MKPFISFCLLLCICLGKLYAQGVNIVYIGNSITQGALLKTGLSITFNIPVINIVSDKLNIFRKNLHTNSEITL